MRLLQSLSQHSLSSPNSRRSGPVSLHRKRARTPLTALCIPHRLYLVPRLSVWLLPCILVLLPQSSSADTIIFHDLSEPVTVSGTDPSRDVVLFEPGYVEVQVYGPNNATLVGFERGPLLVFIIEPNVPIPSADNVPMSDALHVDFEPTLALVDFASFDDAPYPGLGGGGPFLADCSFSTLDYFCMAETGGIQTVTELLWSDGTVDTIQFQSDISSDIPEPSTVMLLATVAGLTMFVGRRRRRGINL